MDDLLKEAIADAKAVRQTAFENAKIALEEAFTPKIQSMLSKKIQTEVEDDEVEEEEGDEEGEKDIDVAVDDSGAEGGDEVAAEDEEEVPAEEGEVEAEEGEEEAEEDEEYPAEEGDEEDSLDLEAIIRELEGEEESDESYESNDPTEEGDGDDVEETIELNGKTYRAVNEEEEGEDETVEEQTDSSDIGNGDNKVDVADGSDEEDPGKNEKSQVAMESFDVDSKIFEEDEEEVDEDIDLEEVLKSLSEEEDSDVDEDEEVKEENVQLKSDLAEHRKVVKYLKSKLNEINLLNAKLLFTNKLFKAYNLNNDEKMKVVETFDRAGNLREIKLVFSTLAESFGYNVTKKTTVPVNSISEGASKAGGSTKPSKVLSEGNALSDRFKKLAGII